MECFPLIEVFVFVSRLASGFPPTLILPPPVAALCGLARLHRQTARTSKWRWYVFYFHHNSCCSVSPSLLHCNCLPRSSISSQVHIWRSWLKLGPRELFEQGIGVSEDCTGVIEGQMVEQDCPMVTRWRRTASVDQTHAPYYLVRPPLLLG